MAAIVRGAENDMCCQKPPLICVGCEPICDPQPKIKKVKPRPPIPPCRNPCCGHWKILNEKPCCYDLPCKADCFNHPPGVKPSGRYDYTVWYPGIDPRFFRGQCAIRNESSPKGPKKCVYPAHPYFRDSCWGC